MTGSAGLGDYLANVLILVAEDDENICELIARILRTENCEVDLVSDGLQAIREFAGRGYNLVITDFDMPGLDGIELARAIRDLGRDVPVVMVTGKPLSDAQTEAIADAGILQIIRKPFRTSEILELRNTYLRYNTPAPTPQV